MAAPPALRGGGHALFACQDHPMIETDSPATTVAERTLTLLDHARLRKLATTAPALQDLLDQVDLVESHDVAPDVVTMNSRVLLADDASRAPRALTLCYPQDAQQAPDCISVLSPAGTSLLGARVGTTVRWHSPAGTRAARIVGLPFQPEAAGEYTR